MVLAGLTRHGYDTLAYQIAHNHFSHLIRCFEKTSSIWEHFAPDAPAEGRGRKDFVGWTGITPIAVFFEYVLGLRADPARKKLVWTLLGTDEMGVDRYPFGRSGSVDLRVARRDGPGEVPSITVKSNVAFELELCWQGGKQIHKVVPAEASER
jgi:hypothetical protein